MVKPVRNEAGIEGPSQLGERYRRELQELVDSGEIGAAAARQILDDLFEPAVRGEPRRLRWWVWKIHVEELSNMAGLPSPLERAIGSRRSIRP
jgi:hypothetical protein